jgi:hypothetical protein
VDTTDATRREGAEAEDEDDESIAAAVGGTGENPPRLP